MKIALAAAAVVALATPALAMDIKWGGDFNNRFSFVTDSDLFKNSGISSDTSDYYNVTTVTATDATNKKNSGDSDFFADIKYRAMLTATDDDKKVKGVLGFEFGSLKYGGNGADFGGDDNVFELMHAYTDFEVPFDSAARMTVGLQPVGYNKFVWSDNAAGVKYSANRGVLSYSLGWFRNDVSGNFGGDGARDAYDDVYNLDVKAKISDALTVGGFVMYSEKGQQTAAKVMDSEIWYGLTAAGKAGMITYDTTGIYLGGDVDDADRSAYLLNAEVGAKIDTVALKLGYLYTSGDDDATDSDLDNFDGIDVFTGGFAGSAVLFANLADDNAPINSFYVQDKGLSLAYLGADVNLTDKASVGASYLWWNTAEDIDGTDADTKGSSDLGHEFAVRGSYKITPALVAAINAGYLIGGDAWDEMQGAAKDADDVFRTDASFRFKF